MLTILMADDCFITVKDLCAFKLCPQLSLSGFSYSRGSGKQDAFSPPINKGCMEKETVVVQKQMLRGEKCGQTELR